MPLSKYFGGHGKEVMRQMKKKHGSKKGESVFYATAKKRAAHGSAPFTQTDIEHGYKVCYTKAELDRMDHAEHMAGMKRGHEATHTGMMSHGSSKEY